MNRPRFSLVLGLPLFLLLPAAGPVFGQPEPAFKKGQEVLARWELRKDPYYPAKVEEIRGDTLRVRYADGTAKLLSKAAVAPRGLRKGDYVRTPAGAGRVEEKQGETVRVFLLDSKAEKNFSVAKLSTLLSLDYLFGPSRGAQLKQGQKVLGKWGPRAWFPGVVSKSAGEALLVVFEDGSKKWIPRDLARPLDLKQEDFLLAKNPRDRQVFPGVFLSKGKGKVRMRFFDGSEQEVSLGRISTFSDQVGIWPLCPCAKESEDKRKTTATLSSWLSPRLHFYNDTKNRSKVATKAEQVEIALALFSPKDRKLPGHWKEILELLAAQVQAFLKRELGAYASIKAYAHSKPVRGPRTLDWYKKNLNEKDDWDVWPLTGLSRAAVFPSGPKAGRHRVVVVLPDTPGISSDSSGVENGMGFVRMKGEWVEKLTVKGLERTSQGKVAETSFDKWDVSYLATTIAHEVLHTLGIPHTDGDPFSVMNLGAWYPIRNPRVHIAALHKLVLRSPFRSSLSLSQGFCWYLLDSKRGYLETISDSQEGGDRILGLHYAGGSGFFRLGKLMESFGPTSLCRSSHRNYTGERAICRAYLASLVDFIQEKYGAKRLRQLFSVSDKGGGEQIANALKTTQSALEKEWHAWLAEKVD
jgi:hypothetical protein